jgi:hypothetical protein
MSFFYKETIAFDLGKKRNISSLQNPKNTWKQIRFIFMVIFVQILLFDH